MSLDVALRGPGCCETCGSARQSTEIFSANITHNLGRMADLAGIYEAVWRPDEVGLETAGQVAPLLLVGLKRMKEEPGPFEALDPPNGWGRYVDFVPWLERYLAACEANPGAKVEVSR